MKAIHLFKFLLISILFLGSTSCEDIDELLEGEDTSEDYYPDISGDTGTGGNSTGKISFYTTSDLGCGNITVTVDGTNSKSISNYHAGGVADCNQTTVTNFTLTAGTHYYTASCNGYSWSLTNFTITDGGCLLYELY